MPTYEYQCGHCGHEMEIFQSITAPAKKKCPQCGNLRLKRLLGTGAGVIFKGAGFYETDYRSDSYKKAAEKENPSAAKQSDAKETKTEVKTETKTESKAKSDSSAKKKTSR